MAGKAFILKNSLPQVGTAEWPERFYSAFLWCLTLYGHGE